MENPSKTKADLAKTTNSISGKCSQLDFSRLSSYISNPVNFSVPLQKASKLLVEKPTNSDNNDNLNNNKELKMSDCETNMAFSSGRKFKTENKTPLNGKQERKTCYPKSSNPLKDEKIKVNNDEETHLPQSQASPIQRTDKPYTNKNNIHSSGEHKHVGSTSTTIKLTSIGINRRKRGAEVLTAEFVQGAEIEKTTQEVSRKSKTGDVKNTAAGSSLLKLKSKTANPGSAKNKDATLKRKTSDTAKNTKLDEPSELKMKAKSLKGPVEKHSDKSIKKSIKGMEKVKKNSHKGISWSGEKPKHDNTKYGADGKSEETIMEKRISMYESHALNLLADLALNSFNSSAALFPNMDAASDSQESKNGTDILVKALHSENRYNTARTCSPPKQPTVSLLSQTTEPDQILDKHDETKKDNESCYINNSSMFKVETNSKTTLNVAVAKVKNNLISNICQEHSYSQPLVNKPKVDPLMDKTNERAIQTHHDPTVKPSMVFDKPQNPACLPRKNMNMKNSMYMNLKKGSRAVLQSGDSLKIALKWDAKYDFGLDSKFTHDSLELTVNRALHGPWNLNLREKVEDVKIILHMWLALFYSKSNNALNCSSRNVVEHSNPAKFVSISTIREPIDMGKIREAENVTSSVCTSGSLNSKLLVPTGNQIASNYSGKLSMQTYSQRYEWVKKEISSADDSVILPVLSQENNITMKDTDRIHENVLSAFQNNEVAEMDTYKMATGAKSVNTNIPILCSAHDTHQIDAVSEQKEKCCSSGKVTGCSMEKGETLENELLSKDFISDKEQETNRDDDYFQRADAVTLSEDASISPKKFVSNVCSNGSENKHQLDTDFALLEKDIQDIDPEVDEAEQDRPASPKKDTPCSVAFDTHKHSEVLKDCERGENKSKSHMISSQSLQEEIPEISGVLPLSENEEEESTTADSRYSVENGGRDAVESTSTTSHQRIETCAGNKEYVDDTMECMESDNRTKTSVTDYTLEEGIYERQKTAINTTSACYDAAVLVDREQLSNNVSNSEDVNTVPLQATEQCRKDKPTGVSPAKESTANDPVSEKLDESKVQQHTLDKSTHVEMCMDHPAGDNQKLAIEPFSLSETDCAVQVELTKKTESTLLFSNEQKSSVLLSIEDNKSLRSFNEETNKANGFMDDTKESAYFSQTRTQSFLESDTACQENLMFPQTEGMQMTCEKSKAGILNKNESSSHVVSTLNEQLLAKSNGNEIRTEEKHNSLIQECAVHGKDIYPLHSCLDTDISNKGQSSSTQNINDQAEKANENKSDMLHVKNVCFDHVQGIEDKVTDAFPEDPMVNPGKENCVEMTKEVNLTVNENLTAPVACDSSEMIMVSFEEKVMLEKQCQNETFDCSAFLAHTKSTKQGDLVLDSEEKDTVEIQEDNGLTTDENSVEKNIFSGDTLGQLNQCQGVSYHSKTSPPFSESLKQPNDVTFQDKYKSPSPNSLDACLTASVNAESYDYWSDDSYEDVAFAQEPENPDKHYSCPPSSDHVSTSLNEAAYSTKIRHTKHLKRKLHVCDVPLYDAEYIPKYFRQREGLRRRKYENVTVSRYFQETGRTLPRKSGSTNRHEPFNVFKERRIASDGPTQGTLDLEHLQFNHRLKGILRNASTETDIFEPSSQTMFESKRIPCCSGSVSKIKHPLLITIQHSDHKRDHTKHRRHNSNHSSSVNNEYELKRRSAQSCRNTKKVSECKKTAFHLNQLKYGNRSKKTTDDDISVILKQCAQSTHLKLNRVSLGDPLIDRTASRNVTEACSRQTFDPDAQNSTVVKDIISDFCTTLHCKLHNVAKQSSRRNFQFYVHETSDDYFFTSVKNVLNQAGHSVSDPQHLCNINEASGEMFVIIRNEDTSAHIQKIPCLLQLRLLPNVTFAGVDNPEDIMDSSYQELLQSGGFVVSDQTVMESISLDKLKDIFRLLKKMNKTSGWKWLVHYRENRKLKDDKRMGCVSQMKISLLRSYQLRNMVEVLPYHLCDSKKKEASDELTCILNLQNQRIQSRLAVYLTDKPSPVREEYRQNGILVLDVDRFIRRIQKLDAQLHSW
ncbi:hypothetical protein XELAEV_18017867mg [Xenopus laevis]|nr:hypothetical protein XELAEV_18017867mg [Xenopus laevis]